MKNDGIKKLYYSIGEVSKMTGLEAHVLRYWETEFEQLHPRKNRAGNRVYTEHDLALVMRIKSLLRDRKFTIEGARQALQGDPSSVVPQHELKALRAFLEDLLHRLQAPGS